MPTLNDIASAAYRRLAGDAALAALCTVYKGPKRPVRSGAPAVTVTARSLEPAGGEGLWMCDLVTTVFTPVLANRMPDHEAMDAIAGELHRVLADAELAIESAKALPLIEGESTRPDWSPTHNDEMMQDHVWGLILVSFG